MRCCVARNAFIKRLCDLLAIFRISQGLASSVGLLTNETSAKYRWHRGALQYNEGCFFYSAISNRGIFDRRGSEQRFLNARGELPRERSLSLNFFWTHRLSRNPFQGGSRVRLGFLGTGGNEHVRIVESRRRAQKDSRAVVRVNRDEKISTSLVCDFGSLIQLANSYHHGACRQLRCLTGSPVFFKALGDLQHQILFEQTFATYRSQVPSAVARVDHNAYLCDFASQLFVFRRKRWRSNGKRNLRLVGLWIMGKRSGFAFATAVPAAPRNETTRR